MQCPFSDTEIKIQRARGTDPSTSELELVQYKFMELCQLIVDGNITQQQILERIVNQMGKIRAVLEGDTNPPSPAPVPRYEVKTHMRRRTVGG